MLLISVFCFAVAITALAAFPLATELPPASSSVISQSNRNCSLGIAKADSIIGKISDESKTRAAMLKLEIARNLMNEGDYKGCATYIDSAMRALTSIDQIR